MANIEVEKKAKKTSKSPIRIFIGRRYLKQWCKIILKRVIYRFYMFVYTQELDMLR